MIDYTIPMLADPPMMTLTVLNMVPSIYFNFVAEANLESQPATHCSKILSAMPWAGLQQCFNKHKSAKLYALL